MNRHAHPWDGDRIAAVRAQLLEFFDELRRELPWRETEDPYRIWVSEVMLQQTRVETVVPYYRRWMERFPTLPALAAADREEVLRLWQGLGYYGRARNLHRAAREIEERYGGALPTSAGELRSLPGIGEYTAGAVASIAFGHPEPAVDGNVRRVMARLLDEPSPTPARLRAVVGALVDPVRPGDFNQSLMELGALICTPRSPDCRRCPVADHCAALAAGTREERPAPRHRGPVPHRTEVVLLLWRESPAGREVLLRRRPPDGLLGGMWECPSLPVSPGEGDAAGEKERAMARLLERCMAVAGGDEGGPPDPPGGTSAGEDLRAPHALREDLRRRARELPAVDHAFSHRRITYRPYHLPLHAGHRSVPPGGRPVSDGEKASPPDPWRWVPLGERSRIPLPVAQETILAGFAAGAREDAQVDSLP